MLTEARHCNNNSHTADYHFKMRFYVVFVNVMYPFVLWEKWQHCFLSSLSFRDEMAVAGVFPPVVKPMH